MEILASHVERALKISTWYGKRIRGDGRQDDLDGAALEGLAHAAAKWDGERDFWKFAATRIFGAMRDELRRGDYLTRNLRAESNDGEMASYVPTESPISMSQPLNTGDRNGHDAVFLGDVIEEDRSDLADMEVRDALLRALALLNERERAVLLLVDIDGYTSSDVARAWGLSVGRISQIRSSAFGHVRGHFADCLEDAA